MQIGSSLYVLRAVSYRPYPSLTFFATSVAWRCGNGSDLSAHLGYDPWGSQGGASSRDANLIPLFNGAHPLGEYPGRPNRQRPPCRFWSGHDGLGFDDHKLARRGRFFPMDEPRALQARKVRRQRHPADEILGLLCARHGGIRGSDRAGTIFRV